MPDHPAHSWLELASGARFDLRGYCTIGRSYDNVMPLANERISRQHALIQAQGFREFWIVDLGSSNGTLVNGRRISHPVLLKEGDVIEMAGERLVFHTEANVTQRGSSRDSMASTKFEVSRVECWFMVADIIGSSRLALELAPEELPQITGTWFKSCRQITDSHGGNMSKYLGDGFFCYWQDREDASRHLAAALGELEVLQKKRQPPFRVVLHHGIAVLRGVPTMSEINLHGPEVNFVFRMEKIAGSRGQPILLSQQAFHKLGCPERFSSDFEDQVDGFQGTFRFYGPVCCE